MKPRRYKIYQQGQWIEVTAEHYVASQSGLGLGDLIGAVATPIARALRLPCIDPATQQLRPESGCAKRKAALNRLTQ